MPRDVPSYLAEQQRKSTGDIAAEWAAIEDLYNKKALPSQSNNLELNKIEGNSDHQELTLPQEAPQLSTVEAPSTASMVAGSSTGVVRGKNYLRNQKLKARRAALKRRAAEEPTDEPESVDPTTTSADETSADLPRGKNYLKNQKLRARRALKKNLLLANMSQNCANSNTTAVESSKDLDHKRMRVENKKKEADLAPKKIGVENQKKEADFATLRKIYPELNDLLRQHSEQIAQLTAKVEEQEKDINILKAEVGELTIKASYQSYLNKDQSFVDLISNESGDGEVDGDGDDEMLATAT